MGTYIARYMNGAGDESWGVVKDGKIASLAQSFESLRDLLANGRDAIDAASQAEPDQSLESTTLLSPLDITSRLFCLGLNYGDHREETGHTAQKPSQMLVFGKDAGSLCGPDANVPKPQSVSLLDYEVELGVIVGKDVSDPTEITDENLEDYVAGLVICNDISARDDQFGVPFMQWYRAKSYRNFCPAGPFVWLPEPGELAKLYDLVVSCSVNGKVVQEAPTANFIFTPPEALSRVSQITPLRAGDCLLTGTPGGVALGLSPDTQALLKEKLFQDEARREGFVEDQLRSGAYLKPGDKIETRIATPDGSLDLGVQRNLVTAA